MSTIFEDIKTTAGNAWTKLYSKQIFCNLKKTELSDFIKVEAIKFLSLGGGKWEPVISLLAAARHQQQWEMSETVSNESQAGGVTPLGIDDDINIILLISVTGPKWL